MIVKNFDDMRLGLTPLSKLYYGHDLIWKREDEENEKKEIIWTNRAYYGTDHHDLKDVAYGNGRYVAVGGIQRIGSYGFPPITAVSLNSNNWSFTDVTNVGSFLTSFGGVAYGDGVFLATYDVTVSSPSDIKIFSSTDGIVWEMIYRERPLGSSSSQTKIIYGGGSFIVWGGKLSVQVSKDRGISWSRVQPTMTASGTTFAKDIQFINGMFVGMGALIKKIGTGTYTGNCLLYSYDGGITWAVVNGTDIIEEGGEAIINFTSLGNDIYISTRQQGVNRIYKADENSFIDRHLWEEIFISNFNESMNPIGGGGILLACFSNSYAISSDEGKTWDYFSSPSALISAGNQIRFLNGKFIAIGNFGRVVVGEIITVSK